MKLACCKGIIDTLIGNKGWGWNLEMCSPEKSSMRNNYGTIHLRNERLNLKVNNIPFISFSASPDKPTAPQVYALQ